RFDAEHDRVVARVVDLRAVGFEWVALNATAIFQACARSVDAMIAALGALHTTIRGAVGWRPAIARAAARISSAAGNFPTPAVPSVAHSMLAQRTMPPRSIKNCPLS